MNSGTTPAAAEAATPRALRPVPTTGGPDHVEVSGTVSGLRYYHGIDAYRLAPNESGTILGADGHEWQVKRSEDGVWAHGSRPRTAAERTAWIDETNQLVHLDYFSKDRLAMAAHIAEEIENIAYCPLPRSGRRAIKNKLAVYSEVLMALVSQRKLVMADMRTRLAAVGLEVPQPTYMVH